MTLSQIIYDFATLAIEAGGWMEMDRLYLQNRIMSMIGEEAIGDTKPQKVLTSSVVLLEQLMEAAKKNQVITDLPAEKEMLEAQLMDFLTPPPSVVNAFFAQHYSKNPVEATDYFYSLSKQNDSIKTRAVAKNSRFSVTTEYGELEIAINLANPEQELRAHTAVTEVQKHEYPRCVLCMENEGYKGRLNYPARTNHRVIRMNLDGESWGFYYSPYPCYEEQSLIVSEEHRPMKLNKETFRQLLRITEVLPHYFAGSNADLPIVDRAILTHAHYQAGRHEFPLAKAPIERLFKLTDYPMVNAGTVKWPISVIRLQSSDKDLLAEAASSVLINWRNYTDEASKGHVYSPEEMPCHALIPIARHREGYLELDLVLKSIHTSAEHSAGNSRWYYDLLSIKKDNIGLIEAMGLAFLPPKLKEALKEVEHYLLGKENHLAENYRHWAEQLKQSHEHISAENVEAIVQTAVGKAFLSILERAGGFTRDKQGQAAFERFTQIL